jgi:hypothetical protein
VVRWRVPRPPKTGDGALGHWVTLGGFVLALAAHAALAKLSCRREIGRRGSWGPKGVVSGRMVIPVGLPAERECPAAAGEALAIPTTVLRIRREHSCGVDFGIP